MNRDTDRNSFIQPKWIRIGFSLGVGIFLACAACYVVVAAVTFISVMILAALGVAITEALPWLVYAVIGVAIFAALMVVPAVSGRFLAKGVNRLRGVDCPTSKAE